jgi:hypothetical protein
VHVVVPCDVFDGAHPHLIGAVLGQDQHVQTGLVPRHQRHVQSVWERREENIEL